MGDVAQITNQLEQINGIESYILVEQDGAVVAHNMKNHDEISSMVTICGIGSSAIMESIGFSRIKYLMLSRIDKRNFLVFLFDEYFLGVQQVSGTDGDQLSVEIAETFNNLSRLRQKDISH